MASHFKQPGDEGTRPHGAAGSSRGSRASGAAAGARGSSRPQVKTRRGGDESYHAPEGNPYAADTPRRSDASFIPAVSSTAGTSRSGGGKRGRRSAHFVETDPYDLSGRRSRDPRKRAGRIISVILFVVGFALIATAGGMWVYNQMQYGEQDRVNEEIAAYADVSDNGTTAPVVDWAGLKAVNDEVVGWIQIPGTVVNFAVCQASDNEKYLDLGVEGTTTLGGSIFMDYANTAPGMIDGQTILYGHHMRNGTMFKIVYDLTNQEMLDGISTVWYVTEDATYELQPLLVYETEADDADARQFTFESNEELRAYLTGLLGRATSQCDNAAEVIAQTSRVLTLCTCDYDNGDNGRALLVCVPKVGDAAETTTVAEAETATTN